MSYNNNNLAEEFTDDDSDDTMMDDDEKDSGRQSGLSVQVVNNQNKVFSQGGFGIDLQSWRLDYIPLFLII